ncbi:MAG: D-2-hydroxyacid dehydrogenase [Pseudomonadota bacterium]
MNKLLILSKDAARYSDLINESVLPQLKTVAFNSLKGIQTACSEANLVFGDPALIREVLPYIPNLQWAQSTWAGVTPLIQQECRKDYLLTGIKDIFGPLMSEYVICYILMHEKKVLKRYASQQQHLWDITKPGQLKNKIIGILGLGSIGISIARTAKFFQMRTKGYSRSSLTCEFIDKGYDRNGSILEFVNDLDYLVSILPDTPATSHLLNKNVFKAMKPQSLLINVGRGNVLDEDDLIKAINNGEISGAVLDVFKEEPLPENHPFWDTPGILVTSHTAALSFPEDIAPVFIENYKLFLDAKPLKYKINFDIGY